MLKQLSVQFGTREMYLQVTTKGGTWGKSFICQAFIPIEEFSTTYKWFEIHTLVGYFMGRISNDSLLHSWVSQVWILYGIKIENV